LEAELSETISGDSRFLRKSEGFPGVSRPELNTPGVERVDLSGGVVIDVDEESGAGGGSKNSDVRGYVMGMAFDVKVPKNLRDQLGLPSLRNTCIWKISFSFGTRGVGGNGRPRMIGKQYSNSPSITIPAVSLGEW
jgi:hypothetical protein